MKKIMQKSIKPKKTGKTGKNASYLHQEVEAVFSNPEIGFIDPDWDDVNVVDIVHDTSPSDTNSWYN